MTAPEHANRLITRHGSTNASQLAGRRVRAWSTLACFPCAGSVPMARVRYWLAIDWHIHHNKTLPLV